MSIPAPVPRSVRFFGAEFAPLAYPDGTWIEAEEGAYPAGGYTRRAWATCEDGKRRIVRASVADSFFTIPARARIGGRRVSGFLTTGRDGKGLVFRASGR